MARVVIVRDSGLCSTFVAGSFQSRRVPRAIASRPFLSVSLHFQPSPLSAPIHCHFSVLLFLDPLRLPIVTCKPLLYEKDKLPS